MGLRRSLGGLAVAVLLLAGCGGEEDARPDLVFVSSRDGDYAIYEMNADGAGQSRLTPREAEVTSPAQLFFQTEPAWSPDGSRIAFSSRRAGSFDLYVMNADGTGTKRLTSAKENETHPTWSPDGRSLAYARGGDIYTVGADGSGARTISEFSAQESDPAWSPDGEWIAYVRRAPGSRAFELWLMRPDGSERHALTRQNGRAATPAWSPDGARIVYATNAESENQSVYELFTIGSDGTGLRRVARTVGDNFEPAWSPDGSTIAYQEDGAIFTVELGAEGAVERLTDSENNDSSPAWNPVPPRE
jgi:TolB protein